MTFRSRLKIGLNIENKNSCKILTAMVLSMIFVASCNENQAIKTEKLNLKEESKIWLCNSEPGDVFLVRDNNGISQSFRMNQNEYYYNQSWSSFLGINTSMTHTEYYYQSFVSRFGNRFSLSLTAGDDPFGDNIYIQINDIGFEYDLEKKVVARLYSDLGNISLLYTDQGYELQDEPITSYVTMLNNFMLNGSSFSNVLEFTFTDFEDKHTDLTIKKVWVAAGTGLIQFQYAGGVTVSRIFQQ